MTRERSLFAITAEVAFRSRTLPLPHQDPADRFIAATAAVFGLTLVTADRQLMQLRVPPILANL